VSVRGREGCAAGCGHASWSRPRTTRITMSKSRPVSRRTSNANESSALDGWVPGRSVAGGGGGVPEGPVAFGRNGVGGDRAEGGQSSIWSFRVKSCRISSRVIGERVVAAAGEAQRWAGGSDPKGGKAWV